MVTTLLIATVAGVLGTGLGGVMGLRFTNSSRSAISFLLSFSSGVMISIICFELIPEALELSPLWQTVLFVALGVAGVQLLNGIIDKISGSGSVHSHSDGPCEQPHVPPDEGRRSMLKSGMVMVVAVALHNLPEGMAIGTGTVHDSNTGIMLAILIAIHNIPEGMTICVPLVEGGMSRGKAVFLTALSGAPTLVGGVIGSLMGGGGDMLMAASLSLAAGAMLYVTYCEILPQVVSLDRGRRPAFFTIGGLLFGLAIVKMIH